LNIYNRKWEIHGRTC